MTTELPIATGVGMMNIRQEPGHHPLDASRNTFLPLLMVPSLRQYSSANILAIRMLEYIPPLTLLFGEQYNYFLTWA
jgi:hypothetical protein